MVGVKHATKQGIIGLIAFYQYCLRPFMGNHCRFYPSCSDYVNVAITRFGIIKGCVLSLQRILKCHPWHEGGCDPVPSIKELL